MATCISSRRWCEIHGGSLSCITWWQIKHRLVQRDGWQRIWVEPLVAPAKAAGRVDLANFPTGQGAGLIRDIPGAAELFARMIGEAEAALRR